MGFFYRKRIKIAPGIYLNASKNGLGISAGIKGCRVSVNSKGDTYLNAGLGGLYYREKLSSGRKEGTEVSSNSYNCNEPTNTLSNNFEILEIDREIASFVSLQDEFLYNKANKLINLKLISLKDIIVMFIIICIIGFIWHPCFLLIIIPIAMYKGSQKQQEEYKELKQECLINIKRDETKQFAEYLSYIKNYPFYNPIAKCSYHINIGTGKIEGIINEDVACMEAESHYYFFIDNGIIIRAKDTCSSNEKPSLYYIPYKNLNCYICGNLLKVINPPNYCDIKESSWEHVNKDGSPSKKYKVNRQISIINTNTVVLEVQDNFNIPILCINKTLAEHIYNKIAVLINSEK